MLPTFTILSLVLIISGIIGTRAAVQKGEEIRAKQYGFVTLFGTSLFVGVLIALALFHT
ncbi:MAG: hypothetical protein WD059_03465 [Balneolaceae bacterium]